MQYGNFCRMAVRALKKSLPLLLTVVAFLLTVKIWRVLSDIDVNVLASVPSRNMDKNSLFHDGEILRKYKSAGGNGSPAQHHIHRTKLLSTAICPSTLFLLILVSTNVGNFDRRHLIRRTWGADYSIETRWKTIFLLGKNQNVEEMEMTKQESQIYGDMVQADYYEHFWNMSFKVAMGFEWSVKYCTFSYLLKADDDVFVNTFELLDFLSKHTTPKKKLYTGNIMVGSVVLRKGRYGVSEEEYNGTVYKPYCSGGGYVLSRDVVKKFLNYFDVLKPLKIDDAYIGLLADRAGVRVTHNKYFRMYEDKCRYLQSTLVQHPARGECAIKLYNNMIADVLGEQFTLER